MTLLLFFAFRNLFHSLTSDTSSWKLFSVYLALTDILYRFTYFKVTETNAVGTGEGSEKYGG